ncbi:MAG: DUF368 domain-containing protein [Cytophagales bacterium]|nr:DUF368 domain-containing protein [Cytophagales bacterium]
MNRSWKEYFVLYAKGVAMGAADVVPGVSGGTIAFISGIYEELLDSIKEFDLAALEFLRRFRLGELWLKVNGSFLLTVLLGIGTSIISLAGFISYLLIDHQIPTWSFFLGLILISALTVLREIKQWNIWVALCLVLGAAAAYFLTDLAPASTPDSWWFIILAGMIAICAMILPGISGSFLLLIMGKYQYVLNAIKNMDLGIILLFGLGCLMGLLSFARVVSWCLKHYHHITVAALSGFMIGSLNKVWPWKVVTEFRVSHTGEQKPFLYENVMPHHYQQLTGDRPLVLEAILFVAVGFFLVVVIEKLAQVLKEEKR